MRVGHHHRFAVFRSFLFAFGRRVPEEETLFGRVASDILASCLVQAQLIRVVSDGNPSKVGYVLPERELPIDLHAGRDFIPIEFRDEPFRFPIKTRAVGLRPPGFPVSLSIKLASLIVKPVSYLVADNRSYCPVIERIVSRNLKERMLQDGRGKYNIVQTEA